MGNLSEVNRKEVQAESELSQDCLMRSQEARIMKSSGHEEILPFFFNEVIRCSVGETIVACLPERILSEKPCTKCT